MALRSAGMAAGVDVKALLGRLAGEATQQAPRLLPRPGTASS